MGVNRAISRMFIVGAILIVALIANLTWVQVFHARSLQDAPANHRVLAQELRVKRGLIVGFDGSTIVGDVKHLGLLSAHLSARRDRTADHRLRQRALRALRHSRHR